MTGAAQLAQHFKPLIAAQLAQQVVAQRALKHIFSSDPTKHGKNIGNFKGKHSQQQTPLTSRA